MLFVLIGRVRHVSGKGVARLVDESATFVIRPALWGSQSWLQPAFSPARRSILPQETLLSGTSFARLSAMCFIAPQARFRQIEPAPQRLSTPQALANIFRLEIGVLGENLKLSHSSRQ